MSDKSNIENKKKKNHKNNKFDEDKQIQYKATKQFKKRKIELDDEDSLKELENYKP